MNKKIFLFWISLISVISILFGYTLVFAWNGTKIEFKSSSNIFLDSLSLNKTQVIFSSKSWIDNLKVYWDCWVNGKLITQNSYLYWYELKFLEKNCDKTNAKVVFDFWDSKLTTSYDINSRFNLYNKYLDYSTIYLSKSIINLSKAIDVLSWYKIYDNSIHNNLYDFKSNNRRLEELEYMKWFLQKIIDDRTQKYKIPLKDGRMSTLSSKLPNAWRPYRADYTDWIHEWWDFDWDFWETVYSIDNWIVVRVVDTFYFSDFDNIVRWDNLTNLERRKNLDILRWKQVWIKTMKWDLAFYSHLDSVFWDISEWDVVMKWQPLWTIGITGVPDKNYSDYHLHLELRKNPYINDNAWKYSFIDYMWWDWYFKWEKESYILENQDNIFN